MVLGNSECGMKTSVSLCGKHTVYDPGLVTDTSASGKVE